MRAVRQLLLVNVPARRAGLRRFELSGRRLVEPATSFFDVVADERHEARGGCVQNLPIQTGLLLNVLHWLVGCAGDAGGPVLDGEFFHRKGEVLACDARRLLVLLVQPWVGLATLEGAQRLAAALPARAASLGAADSLLKFDLTVTPQKEQRTRT